MPNLVRVWNHVVSLVTGRREDGVAGVVTCDRTDITCDQTDITCDAT
jgi:hypothetical protein